MELLKAFVLIYCLMQVDENSCESLNFNTEENSLCLAIEGLPQISRFTVGSTVDFVLASSDSKVKKFLACFEPLLKSKNFAITISFLKQGKIARSQNQRNKNFVVIIVDSEITLKTVLSTLSNDQFNYHGFILIIVTQKSNQEFDLIFDFVWRRFMYNVNIVVENDISVGIFTFFPFSPKKCHDTKSHKINEFKSGNWTSKTFFPEKLRNFHGCKLKAACYEYGPSALRTLQSDGTVIINGSDVEILNGLAEILQINLEIDIVTGDGSWGQVWENGSAIGAFKSIIDREIDICGNFYYLSELRSEFMQFTRAYYSLEMVLMIPFGPPHTPLEKLLRPYEPPVWIAFACFVASTFLAVLIIKLHSRKAQVLFFDRNINSPIMEMLVIIFGGSQHALPRKSISRIFLMSFAMFCLVVRSIYTGSLYKFLQSDGHKKDYQTIDELMAENFNFHMDPGIEHMMEYTKFYKR